MLLSKLKFNRQLDGTRAADLIERVEATALPAAAQRAGQHLRRLAELRGAEEVDWAAKVEVVEDIEEVGARLKSQPLGEAERSAQCGVELDCIAATQRIAPQVSLH